MWEELYILGSKRRYGNRMKNLEIVKNWILLVEADLKTALFL